MKQILISILLIFGHSLLYAGSANHLKHLFTHNSAVGPDSLILKLAEMKTDTLDCSADAYWQIIAKGKEYIPKLIAALTDTTPTSIYNLCKGGNLNIGDLCYFALEEIGDFPAYIVTRIQFDVIEVKDNWSCWSFYEYLFDNRNKLEYQEKAKTFYEKSTFKFVKFPNSKMTDCMKMYNITGRYKFIEYKALDR
ncbi:hypothetical protein [Fluviicola sp.]|uniref:hypothetical protein n=1 Tax=Fluviicola sp. TaxID=1917219 RepID=UPI003D2CB6BC